MKTVYLVDGFVIDNLDHAKIMARSNNVVSVEVDDNVKAIRSSIPLTSTDLEAYKGTFTINLELHTDYDEYNDSNMILYKMEGRYCDIISPITEEWGKEVEREIELDSKLKFEDLSSELMGAIYNIIKDEEL